MEILAVTEQNLEQEHICCAIADRPGETKVSSKKQWMKERFSDGLEFWKVDARGKAFLEFIPAEKAWCPVSAEGYLFLDCFWVSGQLKGQGNGDRLLQTCISRARELGKLGICAVSSAKKRPYLSDPKFLRYKGFLTADAAAPYFELLYLPLSDSAPIPRFRDCARQGKTEEPGWVLYYTHQCPFTAQYAPLAAEIAHRHGIELTLRRMETTEQAQSCPSPFPTYSLFRDGSFVTHEIMSEKKLEQLFQGQ